MPDLLAVARAELGTYESPLGSNKTKYGEWYGFNGQPWCAIFLSWCCARSGIKWRYASTVAARNAAAGAGLWSRHPKVGWACMKQYTTTTGHIGVVEFVHKDGTITSIEGNTNAAGSREGDGVYRKRRSASWWSGYINLPALLQVAPTPPEIEDDEMKPRLVRAPDGAVYAFDGVALRPANNPDYQNIVRWYAGQADSWDNWSQEQINACPKEAGAPE